MRYLLAIALAFSFIGVTSAAGIPTAVQPQHAPEIWTQEVYNNDTTSLTSGQCVVWDMDKDTTDASYAYRTSWVKISEDADDLLTAGVVVSDSIAATSPGTICIYGPVYTLVADVTGTVTASQAVGTSTVDGMCDDAASANIDNARLGWVILDDGVDTAYGGYGAGGNGSDGVMMPIFVNIN